MPFWLSATAFGLCHTFIVVDCREHCADFMHSTAEIASSIRFWAKLCTWKSWTESHLKWKFMREKWRREIENGYVTRCLECVLRIWHIWPPLKFFSFQCGLIEWNDENKPIRTGKREEEQKRLRKTPMAAVYWKETQIPILSPLYIASTSPIFCPLFLIHWNFRLNWISIEFCKTRGNDFQNSQRRNAIKRAAHG